MLTRILLLEKCIYFLINLFLQQQSSSASNFTQNLSCFLHENLLVQYKMTVFVQKAKHFLCINVVDSGFETSLKPGGL